MPKNTSHFSQIITAPVTALACLWCVVVFAGLSEPYVSWEAASQWGYFPDSAVWEGKPWALISSGFVHRELWHIAFNLYWLWLLGSCFEKSLGSLRWLLFLVGALWVSASAELLLGGSSGIGMSGVGYALFGFGWVARRKLPRFAEILTDQVSQIFVLWLFLCIALTNFGLMQIANWAHIFGLAFGVSVAALWVARWRPWVSSAGLVFLLAASFVPLAWCPTSVDWTGVQATRAQKREDYGAAINWYQRSLALGQDPEWVWANLAQIYGFQRNKTKYAEAITKLRGLNEKTAAEIEADYGLAVSPSQPR